jgi:hypothetical protein
VTERRNWTFHAGSMKKLPCGHNTAVLASNVGDECRA